MNKALLFYKKYGMFVLLILLVAGFSLSSPRTFFTSTTFYNILKQASVLGVLSCGVTLLLITGAMDISIGARVGLICVQTGALLQAGCNIYLIILLAVLTGALTGALNSVLAELLHTHIFVTSMAMMYVWVGACYLAVGPVVMYNFPAVWKNISQYQFFGQFPSIIIWFIVCALLAGFILEKTYFGRYIYAIGGNREAAYLAGINVVKFSILTHAFSGVFVGLAAVILTSRVMTASAATSGASYAFDCITACVLGGVMLSGGSGRMYQSILGVLVLNVLFNGLTIIHVNDYWQMVVKGMVLIAAIGLEVLQRYSKVNLSVSDEKAGKKDALQKAAG
jgi:ribose/xylose/arabinose/galactoside ABC-type transport system permease subunit